MINYAKNPKWKKLLTDRQLLDTVIGTITAPPTPKPAWNAGWREIGGQRKYFRSKWEANYARYLELLKSKGQLHSWEHEPETFWFKGIKRGCVSYLPDFRITEMNGKIAYHEVKGFMDHKSQTKINRMAKYYPKVTIRVIDAAWFKHNNKMLAGIIPDWE